MFESVAASGAPNRLDMPGPSSEGVGRSTNTLFSAPNRKATIWASITMLLLLATSVGLLAARQSGLQNWYLLSAPILVGAYRFGLRGALLTSSLSVISLMATFELAGSFSAQ